MDVLKQHSYGQIGFGYGPRAIYATNPLLTRGRLFAQPESPTRTAFQRDRDRIIHSNAFRRLKHKTQVFIAEDGDHYRTRLTHSIEVSQIARALARALKLDEDLSEAIALAHDFGHTPFGHAGEEVLNRSMRDFGGFDHNTQGLRIVTKLEKRYPEFSGLNLTWEVLEGLAKHNGPLKTTSNGAAVPLHGFIKKFNVEMDLELEDYAGPEAQCAAIADDIAYNAHDIDDGLRSGLLKINDLREVPLSAKIIAQIEQDFPTIDQTICGYELVRRQITLMVEDVISQSYDRINRLQPKSVDDIHKAGIPVVSFSDTMKSQEQQMKQFLYDRLYYHPTVLQRRKAAEKVVDDLFKHFMENANDLPLEWKNQAETCSERRYARLVCDFISGMTDNYAIRQHHRLFDLKL